jgi:hypothetical protein
VRVLHHGAGLELRQLQFQEMRFPHFLEMSFPHRGASSITLPQPGDGNRQASDDDSPRRTRGTGMPLTTARPVTQTYPPSYIAKMNV